MSNWVIKWNIKNPNNDTLGHDWRMFLRGRQPFKTYGYDDNRVNIARFNRAMRRDVVFCYQTDEKSIVGTCFVQRKVPNDPDGRCLLLRRRKLWDSPINIPKAKKAHKEIKRAAAFRRGAVLAIYPLTAAEAEILLNLGE